MRLLILNLAVDEDDPLLGFATRWIEALARRAEAVHVVTMKAGRSRLPGNVKVFSVGKERGYGKPRRALRFYREICGVLGSGNVDACFCHMIPLFAVLASPVLKSRRIPLVTWYAHPSRTLGLRLAHILSDRIVTSFPSAYPLKGDKLAVIGQGIDTVHFSPGGRAQDPPLILCVGRLSPVKDHPTLLRAAARLRRSIPGRFTVAIVGSPATPAQEGYAASLRRTAAELGLESTVRFVPSVPWDSLADWYRRCAVHVNLTPSGFGDKVALEAMSCGRPCVVANEDFGSTLGSHAGRLLFTPGDDEALARRLADLLAGAPGEREAMGADLRDQVIRLHGLERLADRLMEILESVGRRRTGILRGAPG